MATKFVLMGIVVALALLPDVQCRLKREIKSQEELRGMCNENTGMDIEQIASVIPRNENCAFDCTTKQGTVQAFYARDRTPCHNSAGYECSLGKCRTTKEALVVSTNNLYNVEIRIVEAHVADLDTVPSSGHSDAFVTIDVVSGGSPSYENGEQLCHTYTVLDSGNPKWRRFVCKTLPLKKSAMLKFSVYDSDKPVVMPDFLGRAEESLEFLMNRGETLLPLRGIKGNHDITVDITAEPYKPDGQ